MYQQVLDFWFQELKPKQWWVKSEALDTDIKERFGELHRAASVGELFQWRETPDGSLAEILVLDQFSRNIYRDGPGAFACDPLALALAQTAVAKGFDKVLAVKQTHFLYMPYMHSESLVIHQEAVRLFTELGNQDHLRFELRHKAIIDQFGRYLHRNEVLDRESTPEEIEFLKKPGSGF